MTFDFIVKDILGFISNEDKLFLKSFNEKDLISLHSSFGRNIRNTYNLWHEPLEDENYKNKHPDDISMEIIKTIWKELI